MDDDDGGVKMEHEIVGQTDRKHSGNVRNSRYLMKGRLVTR